MRLRSVLAGVRAADQAGLQVVGREVLRVGQEAGRRETDGFQASRVVAMTGRDRAVITRRRLVLGLIFFRQRCGLATA